MAESASLIAAEFQALPLEFLIAAPLIGAVKAQAVSAAATKSFIEGMVEKGKPITVDFEVQRTVSGETNKVMVRAPLLAIVPVPHLRIESITSHFHFEITQTYRNTTETSKGFETSVSSGKFLSPWVSASLKGSISSKASQESTTNRSGQLDITVLASEAAVPEGLSRVLSLLTSAIQLPDDDKPQKP